MPPVMRRMSTPPDPLEFFQAAGTLSFTLIELLVVIAIIAVLAGILVPVLGAARQHSRMTVCLSHLRSQGQVLHQYASEYKDALPPKHTWQLASDGAHVTLLNKVLARYLGQPFEPVPDEIYATPTGIFRCPAISVGEDFPLRWSHSGTLHYAANTWLFNNILDNQLADFYRVVADVLAGWTRRYGNGRWRRLGDIPRQTEIIAIMDTVITHLHGPNHLDAREEYGYGCEVLWDPSGGSVCGDNVGSHDKLGKRPALLLDGHGESIPISAAYWQDVAVSLHPAEDPSITHDVYQREIQRFFWFVRPEDHVNSAP